MSKCTWGSFLTFLDKVTWSANDFISTNEKPHHQTSSYESLTCPMCHQCASVWFQIKVVPADKYIQSISQHKITRNRQQLCPSLGPGMTLCKLLVTGFTASLDNYSTPDSASSPSPSFEVTTFYMHCYLILMVRDNA